MSHYAGTAVWLLVTISTAIGSYTVNLKVAGARAEVAALRGRLVADTRAIRTLQAELRTRARLPEMQRWNDDVLKMSAPAAGQYLPSARMLASFVPDPDAAAPTPLPAPMPTPMPRYAVTGDAPMPVPGAGGVVTVAYAAIRAPERREPARVAAPAALPAGLPAVTQIAFRDERPRPRPAAPVRRAAAAAAAAAMPAAPRLADDVTLTAGPERWSSQRSLAIEIAAPTDLLPPGAR